MSNRQPLSVDAAGVSELTGVLILVILTIVITASIGVQVLVENESEQTARSAQFSFQYISGPSVLIVTHESGDTYQARNLLIRGPSGNNATWAELAGSNESAVVGPESTVQLSRQNAYGANVNEGDNIRILYVSENGTERELDAWES